MIAETETRTIFEHVRELPFLANNARKLWVGHLFHYTSIEQVITILELGYLLSRELALAQDLLVSDIASVGVLEGTPDYVKRNVRFYFRPRTPAQFNQEGIRCRSTQNKYGENVHCPVPVFLIFDAAKVLAIDGAQFSDGNLGSQHAHLASSAAELANLPWQNIYHDSPHSPSDRTVVYHKSAEVVVPDRVPLTALRFLLCRSVAEKETLLDIMPDQVRRMYERRVLPPTAMPAFFMKHTFVTKSWREGSLFYLEFSPETSSWGPFDLSISVVSDGNTRQVLVPSYTVQKHPMRIKLAEDFSKARIQLWLDNHLAFSDTVSGTQHEVF